MGGSEFLAGMSLRDYFAAKVLLGLVTRGTLAVPHQEGWEASAAKVARMAYSVADAMLKARETQGPE